MKPLVSVIEASRRGGKQGDLGELNLEPYRLLLFGGSLNKFKEALINILILVDEAPSATPSRRPCYTCRVFCNGAGYQVAGVAYLLLKFEKCLSADL